MNYRLGESITRLFKPGMLGMPDKSAAEGSLVYLDGDEIKANDGKHRPDGVYTAGSWRKMMLLTGERVEVTIPEGVIYYGEASVKVAK